MATKEHKETRFVFVIDTRQYSGNFERQMCAYLTGVVGECEVGEEYAELFENEVPPGSSFEDIILQVDHDSNGFERPCAIWPTPGRINNGRGLILDEDSPEGRIQGHKYPAYESVAIFFSEAPPEEAIALLKERALKFSEAFRSTQPGWRSAHLEPITVTGFRMLKQTTTTITEEVEVPV